MHREPSPVQPKFGTGKRSDWIKQHHWEAGAIFVGVAVGFSEAESEW